MSRSAPRSQKHIIGGRRWRSKTVIFARLVKNVHIGVIGAGECLGIYPSTVCIGNSVRLMHRVSPITCERRRFGRSEQAFEDVAGAVYPRITPGNNLAESTQRVPWGGYLLLKARTRGHDGSPLLRWNRHR
jgi:hypothetical protein